MSDCLFHKCSGRDVQDDSFWSDPGSVGGTVFSWSARGGVTTLSMTEDCESASKALNVEAICYI
jgi:hypothetical protein